MKRQPSTSRTPSSRCRIKAGARIREHVLANGMRVLLAERRSDPVVAVMTWYRVGVRNETEREAGFSHFLEHMMFKGSRRFGRGEIDRQTTALGGTNNAFTSHDHTAYWFELASDRWEFALEVEADRMRHLTLDASEFESERKVVLEELSMGKDDPWRRLSESVAEALFTRHPYRRPVIGYADSLRAAEVGDLRNYYQRFYGPRNAVLVLCGDFRSADALRRVEALFGSQAPGPSYEDTDCFRPVCTDPSGERRIAMEWDDAAHRLCMAWPTSKVGSDDDYVLDIIATWLASGRLSRFYRRLVMEEGLATTFSVSNDTRVDTGVLWLMAECRQGVDPGLLEKAVDEEIARLAREGLTASELRRTKSILSASEAYDAETASDLAENLGEYAIDSDWNIVIDGMKRLQAVSSAAVRECVSRLLSPRRRVVGWCQPDPANDHPERPASKRKGRAKPATARRKAARKSGRAKAVRKTKR